MPPDLRMPVPKVQPVRRDIAGRDSDSALEARFGRAARGSRFHLGARILAIPQTNPSAKVIAAKAARAEGDFEH